MSEEEIFHYLKRVDELENKLTGYDKETLQWLIFGYNECAKLLNEKERKIDSAIDYINFLFIFNQTINGRFNQTTWGQELLEILKGGC